MLIRGCPGTKENEEARADCLQRAFRLRKLKLGFFGHPRHRDLLGPAGAQNARHVGCPQNDNSAFSAARLNALINWFAGTRVEEQDSVILVFTVLVEVEHLGERVCDGVKGALNALAA